LFFFSSRRRHTRFSRDWSSDVCSSDLYREEKGVDPVSNTETFAQCANSTQKPLRGVRFGASTAEGGLKVKRCPPTVKRKASTLYPTRRHLLLSSSSSTTGVGRMSRSIAEPVSGCISRRQ